MADTSRTEHAPKADQNGPQQAGGATYTNQHGDEQQGIGGPGAGDGAGTPGAELGEDRKPRGNSGSGSSKG